jgi:arylsulfatase A-like enzyme
MESPRARTRPARRGALLVLLALGVGCGADPRAADVIFVTLDTTRGDHLGVYGYPHPITPELDAFAREATLYERAWTTAPWTLPAHASMFTGKYPTSHGAHFDRRRGDSNLGEAWHDDSLADVRADRLPESEVTLAELLRDRGYATGVFAGGPWLSPPFGLLQGYQHQDADVHDLAGRSARELTDAALAFVAEVPGDQPLHLLVNYFDAHAPYEPAEQDLLPSEAYEPADEGAVEDRSQARIRYERAVRGLVRKYDGEIREMDRHFGRLLDGLRAAGRYQNALVVVVGDHGELFGEHDQFMHGSWHYEELLRVPLIVRLPGGRDAGTRVATPISVVDLLPLIASQLSIPLPAGVEGVAVGARGVVIAESYADPRAIAKLGPAVDRRLTTAIRWPWKLIASSAGPPQLFRLDEDPHEADDRSARDPEIVASLEDEIARAKAAMSAPEAVAPEGVDSTTVERLRELGYVE